MRRRCQHLTDPALKTIADKLGHTLDTRSSERCPDSCTGHELGTRTFAGQRHLSATGASDRHIPANNRG
jgi:hypothetical protein